MSDDTLRPQPDKLGCGCIVMARPQGKALVPRCPEHIQDPMALGIIASRIGNTKKARVESSTFSYSGDPSLSLLDEVRFLIGDTNAAQPLLQDGEITWLLGESDLNPMRAAMQACETIMGKLARNRDETVGSVSIRFSQQYDGYIKLLDTLRRRLSMNAMPYAGGISRSDKYIRRMDGDRVRPTATVDMYQRFPDEPELALRGRGGAWNGGEFVFADGLIENDSGD